MTKLASVAELREVMGFSDIPQFERAAEQALRLATPMLLSALRVKSIRHADMTEDFWVGDQCVRLSDDEYPRRARSDTFNPLRGGAFRTSFILDRALLDTDVAVSVYVAGDSVGLGSATVREPLIDGVDGVSLETDYEHGFLNVLGYDLTGLFVRVEYRSGIPATGPTFDTTTIPAWLHDAALLQARVLLASNTVLYPGGDDSRPSVDEVRALRQVLTTTLIPHIRYRPLFVKSVRVSELPLP